MAVSNSYIAECRKSKNQLDSVIELALDSGTIKLGFHNRPADGISGRIKSISSFTNKIDTKAGFGTRGTLSVTIAGKAFILQLIKDNYLMSRRVTRKDGFIGIAYADYAGPSFSGQFDDYSLDNDEMNITFADDLAAVGNTKVPATNATGTQCKEYRNDNIVDVIKDIIVTLLGVSTSYVESTNMSNERDTWLPNVKVCRVLTDSTEGNELLNELQVESASYVIHNGAKIDYKVDAPPVPGQTVEEWTDGYHIKHGTCKPKSGYKDNFYNRIEVFYDFDESGGNNDNNFESRIIAADVDSQGASQWNKTRTLIIKSKWFHTYTFTQASNITGLKVFHASKTNGAGNGTLTYTASTKTLTYTAPGGSAGEAVTLDKDGKYQVFSSNKLKYVRVLVTVASLPGGNQTDTITFTAMDTETYLNAFALRKLNRYRNPAVPASLQLDMNNLPWNSALLKPSDLKYVTSDYIAEYGESSWNKEPVMVTSVRPDHAKGVIDVEVVETKRYRRTGFIAPAGLPDYGSATDAQKQYGYIRNTSPQYHIY